MEKKRNIDLILNHLLNIKGDKWTQVIKDKAGGKVSKNGIISMLKGSR